MKKITKRITGLTLGLVLVGGAGATILHLNTPIIEINANEGDTHDFSQSLSQLLNNNAKIPSIEINDQGYNIKKIEVACKYNKDIDPAVTIQVYVGDKTFGDSKTVGCNFDGTKVFTGEGYGKIKIVFTNNCVSGTGKGTFSVSNVKLTEGKTEVKTLTSIVRLDGTLKANVGDESFDTSTLTPMGTLDDSEEIIDVSHYVSLTPKDVPGTEVCEKQVEVEVADISGGIATKSFNVAASVTEPVLIAEKDSFTEIAGDLNTDISFAATQGGGTVIPAISSNKIRLYKPSGENPTGGELEIKLKDSSSNANKLLKSVSIRTNRENGFKYSADGDSLKKISSKKIGDVYEYVVDSCTNNVTFYNIVANSNDVSFIHVEYCNATVLEWATRFLELTDSPCKEETIATKIAGLENVWGQTSSAFSKLSEAEQTKIKNATYTTDILGEAVKRYDYIIKKYSSQSSIINNYIERDTSTNGGTIINNNNIGMYIAIIAVTSLVAVSAIGGYFFVKKSKKEK